MQKYNEVKSNLKNLTPFEIQKAYMQIVGQINEHGGVLIPVDYIHFTNTEIVEFFTAFVNYTKSKSDDHKLEMLDALCDIVVCALGSCIVYFPKIELEEEFIVEFEVYETLNAIKDVLCEFAINTIEGYENDYELSNLINKIYSLANYYHFNFNGALLEVFRINFERLQFDKNGNVLKQPEFLEDGSKNPNAGKVIKKDLKPNLKPFLN